MVTLTCPECDTEQEVAVSVDTYVVVCEHCGDRFDIPRKHRVNKREVREYKSRVNIRVGVRTNEDTITVGWAVQSAEKGNRRLEKDSVVADVADHPQKTYWYVAIFKMLQHISDYKSARIWIKHDLVLDHLSGEANIPDDDLRSRLAERIIDMCDEKFYGYEFAEADSVGRDIGSMIS